MTFLKIIFVFNKSEYTYISDDERGELRRRIANFLETIGCGNVIELGDNRVTNELANPHEERYYEPEHTWHITYSFTGELPPPISITMNDILTFVHENTNHYHGTMISHVHILVSADAF